MMKTGQQREVGIVNQRGVKRDVGAGRAAAEEVDPAALADQPDRRFPGFRLADRFDDNIERRGVREGLSQIGLADDNFTGL